MTIGGRKAGEEGEVKFKQSKCRLDLWDLVSPRGTGETNRRCALALIVEHRKFYIAFWQT